ncbi:MAG: NTP transferase domain-containing protein [Alphaproteobacteria bacterium]|nr:NTP transferase domain-containing protein [Alphaproteobacteria bacterium]
MNREHIRVVAVIQARMGSTRFPGKVLKPVAGKPLLWHIVHRLRQCALVEEIAVATSTNPRDDAIVEWGAGEGIMVVRGPEDDVLARYARAAEALDADIIVRVSSDAPFIDAGFVDHLVATLIEQDGDYVLMQEGIACAHEGADPFSRRALDKLMMDAGSDPAAREHVTGYFKLHPDFVKIVRATPYPGLTRKGGRLTIDTPDDLAFVEAVHARMSAKAGEASLADLLLLLEREPELARINGHVRQKPIIPSGGLALIRCDGGGKFGYGHVKRMVSLARALRDRESIGAVFAVNGTTDALAPIRRAGFEAQLLSSEEHLNELVARLAPQILLLDCREGPGRAALEALAHDVAITAVIDDGSERRLAADFAYYPPVPQVHALEWTGARTVPRIGWQWSLTGLNPHLTPARALATRPTLLVAMGGSDPFGLTVRAAQALTGIDPAWRVRFVIGAGMRDGAANAAAIVALSDRYETVEHADDLALEYAHADLGLCAFGVTAYEMAAFGVPALYLGLTEDHCQSARAFDEAGMGQLLGLSADVKSEDLAKAVGQLIQDAPRRRQMRKVGLSLIDGEGAARIAADLAQALKEEQAPRSAGQEKLKTFP